MSAPILALDGVSVRYPGAPRDTVTDISFEVAEGESIGLVGESGAGKSTILKTMLGILRPSAGTVLHRGEELRYRDRDQMRAFRGDVQTVFQDPYSSLDPRARVGTSVAEPLRSLGIEADRGARERIVAELLRSVGLPADAADRYPAAFSGGQRQRIAIARALAPNPALLLADEPVSALDMSVRTKIIDLLRAQRENRDLAMVLVSHDLSIVAALCDSILVLQNGTVVERGEAQTVLTAPEHPYTRQLLAAIPRLPR